MSETRVGGCLNESVALEFVGVRSFVVLVVTRVGPVDCRGLD